MEVFHMRDRDLVVAAPRAATDLDPDQRDLFESGLVVSIVFPLGFHCRAAFGALHFFFLQAVTRTNCVLDRKQMTTAMRSVSKSRPCISSSRSRTRRAGR